MEHGGGVGGGDELRNFMEQQQASLIPVLRHLCGYIKSEKLEETFALIGPLCKESTHKNRGSHQPHIFFFLSTGS